MAPSRASACTGAAALAAWLALAPPGVAAPAPSTSSAVSPAPTPSAVAGPSVVKVFTLRHRRAEDALLLVRPLLSADGSVWFQPRLNALTVRDTASVVERASQAIRSWDQPPRALSVSVSLLRATSEPSPPGAREPVAEEIRSVGARLKKLFSFTGYQRLDAVVVEGVEGVAISYALGGEYRLDFQLEPVGDDAFVRLKGLVLSRVRKEGTREIARTSVNLKLGEPFVLGIGRDEPASSALFLVFTASPRTAGPGLGGVR